MLTFLFKSISITCLSISTTCLSISITYLSVFIFKNKKSPIWFKLVTTYSLTKLSQHKIQAKEPLQYSLSYTPFTHRSTVFCQAIQWIKFKQPKYRIHRGGASTVIGLTTSFQQSIFFRTVNWKDLVSKINNILCLLLLSLFVRLYLYTAYL